MSVNFCVRGSNIAMCRVLSAIGSALANLLGEPWRQNAGVAVTFTAAEIHTRPWVSIVRWFGFDASRITMSSPKLSDGLSIVNGVNVRIFALSICAGIGMVVSVCSSGSRATRPSL